MSAKAILNKLRVRNILSLATSGTFLWTVWYTITQQPEVLENPLVTFLLGTFGPIVMMVYVFHYRKAQSKEANPDPD